MKIIITKVRISDAKGCRLVSRDVNFKCDFDDLEKYKNRLISLLKLNGKIIDVNYICKTDV